MAEYIYSYTAHFKSADNIAHELRDASQCGCTKGQTPEHAEERVTRGLASHGYTDIRVHVVEPLQFMVDNLL